MKASSATSSSRTKDVNPTRNAGSSSSTEQFSLVAPAPDLDPRYDAYRGDLADIALAGRLFVPHYVVPLERSASEAAILRHSPSEAGEELGTVDQGTAFFLLDIIGDWAWGYRGSDHLVGYVKAAELGA